MPKQSLESRRGGTTEQSCLHKLLALACQEEVRRLPMILPISQQALMLLRHQEKHLYLSIYLCMRVSVYMHITPIHGELCYFFSTPQRVKRTETCLTLYSVYSLWQPENDNTEQSGLATARATGTWGRMSYPAGPAEQFSTALL